MERKGCESIIHDHYRDLCMCNHGGVGRLPDSDWGDFRRRRAHDYWVYTGSFTYILMLDNSRAFDTTDRSILLQNLIESDELHALCESSFKREVITSH